MAQTEWARITVHPPLSASGCVYGGPKFGFRRWTRDSCPGGEYSGCPGSRSRSNTPAGLFDRDLGRGGKVNRRLTRSLANVDFPDDFGPQIIVLDILSRFHLPEDTAANVSFHSGGE